MSHMKNNDTPSDDRNKVLTFLNIENLGAVIPGITAGLISGVITVIIEISFAALIFSGDLAAFVSHGIGFTLFGSGDSTAVLAATSLLVGPVVAIAGIIAFARARA